jgi:protease YdgD
MDPIKALTIVALLLFPISCTTAPVPHEKKIELKKDKDVTSLPSPLPPHQTFLSLSAIGRVNRQGHSFCTGVLISAAKVLTTAHCLWDQKLRRWAAVDDLHFLAGYHLGKYLAHRRVKAIELPSGIRMLAQGFPYSLAKDWAILTLDRAVETESKVHPVKLAEFGGEILIGKIGPLVSAGYGPLRPYAVASQPCKAIKILNSEVLLNDCSGPSAEYGFPVLVKMSEGWRVLGLQMKPLVSSMSESGQSRALLVPTFNQRRQMLVW